MVANNAANRVRYRAGLSYGVLTFYALQQPAHYARINAAGDARRVIRRLEPEL